MIVTQRIACANELVRLMSLHDPETAAHLEATAALARRISLSMGLRREQVETIELAARLHDVGKMSVDITVLVKSAALDPEEWQQLRMHAEAGEAIVAEIPELADLGPIIGAHHERPDGFGYPRRLRLAEIPLEARVVAVADSFHAMTTDRPYCKARTALSALMELEANAGSQFDVDVVKSTLKMYGYTRRKLQAALAS
ncbi:MAG: hypothetical protein NVSMB64_21550 [Candidatus Velthaea sp.]